MKESFHNIAGYYFERFGFETGQIEPALDENTKMIIVIPIHNEPDITATLNSLQNCEQPDSVVEFILVVNNSESADQLILEQNSKTIEEIQLWSRNNPNEKLVCHVLREMGLPRKHAGVGLARKIGMDEALRRFATINYNGLIVCLDADCTVRSNYLRALESEFAKEDFIAGNIHYEHNWKDEDTSTTSGIIQYELGLRYYVNALRFAGYPYAYHTIGSSMAVSAKTYAKSGGMNKRKAGEDFYFLHKLIPLGGFRKLNSTTVYPSSRVSERVPFGTGRAMLKWKEQLDTTNIDQLTTYRFEVFQDLKELIVCIPSLRTCGDKEQYDQATCMLPDSVQEFLTEHDFHTALIGCIDQSTSEITFLKRIYTWLDGFGVLKFVHFARDHFYPNISVELCAVQLLESLEVKCNSDPLTLLEMYRNIDTSR